MRLVEKRVVMGRALGILVMLLLVPATALALQCCITDGMCLEDDDFFGECPGELLGFSCAIADECNVVCCCALPGAYAPDDWNSEQSNMMMTQNECLARGSNYEWNPFGDCVSICGGGTYIPPDTVIITGTVFNSSPAPFIGAQVSLEAGAQRYNTLTDATGAFELSVPKDTAGTVVATAPGCTAAFSVYKAFPISQSVGALGPVDCSILGCVPTAPQIESVSFLRGTDKAAIDILFNDDCSNLIEFIITAPPLDSVPTPEINAEMEGLAPNTEYCFKVRAQLEGVGVIPTAGEVTEVCRTSGDAECMVERETSEWCDNTGTPKKVVSCTDDGTNTLNLKTECAPGQFCSRAGAGFECILSPICEECNGIFGVLGDQNFAFSLVRELFVSECTEANLDGLCFKDRSQTITDGWRGCEEVTYCEDYNSAGACGQDPCDLQDGCQWFGVNNELGTGICRSDSAKALCNSCEGFFGYCDENLCNAMGARLPPEPSDCYYDALSNGIVRELDASRCIHKDDVPCRYYDTQEDCIGPGQSQYTINIQYPTGSGISNGGNHLYTPSEDLYGIGKCLWNAADGYCYKDSDGKTNPRPEDDCIENTYFRDPTYGRTCLVDAEAPRTDVFSSGFLGLHELGNRIEVTVSDNRYPEELIDTRFCVMIKGSGSPCYPDTSLSDAIDVINLENIGDSDVFVFRYFSLDPSGNVEEIKETEISVVQHGMPYVDDAYIE